ncbi:MAG: hypothetical protein ACOCQR_03715, partial [bacterium]
MKKKKCLVFCILFMIVFISLTLIAQEDQDMRQQDNKLYYFYGSTCPYCYETTPMIEKLEKRYPDLDVKILEVWEDPNNAALFTEKMSEIKQEARGVPTVVFHGKSYIGANIQDYINLEKEIRKLFAKDTIEETNLDYVVETAEDVEQTDSAVDTTENVAYFFYSENCSYSAQAKPIVEELSKRYPEIEIENLKVWEDTENAKLFSEMMSNVTEGEAGVPTLIFNDTAFIGFSKDVYEQVEDEIRKVLNKENITNTKEKYATEAVEIQDDKELTSEENKNEEITKTIDEEIKLIVIGYLLGIVTAVLTAYIKE